MPGDSILVVVSNDEGIKFLSSFNSEHFLHVVEGQRVVASLSRASDFNSNCISELVHEKGVLGQRYLLLLLQDLAIGTLDKQVL